MFYFFKIPSFIHKIYPKYLWKMPNKPKAIYLTFDDGPTPEVTDWVLKILKEYNAKATFFCEGQNVEKHPKLLKKLHSENHSIGNHSYSHFEGWKTNTTDYIADVEKASLLIDNTLKNSLRNTIDSKKLFRPPYGKIRTSQAKALQKLGYSIVMFAIVSGDYDQNINPKKSLKKVLKYTKSGSIVVFHDSKKAFKILKQVLPQALEVWSKKGYEFLAL